METALIFVLSTIIGVTAGFFAGRLLVEGSINRRFDMLVRSMGEPAPVLQVKEAAKRIKESAPAVHDLYLQYEPIFQSMLQKIHEILPNATERQQRMLLSVLSLTFNEGMEAAYKEVNGTIDRLLEETESAEASRSSEDQALSLGRGT